MLVTRKVFTVWNSRTKKYYEGLGYEYTKMNDEFKVDVFDLKDSSMVKVLVVCDYCKNQYETTWYRRKKLLSDGIIKKDSCGICKSKKAREGVIQKYGVDNVMKIDEVYQKQRISCEKSIGYKNPFSSPEIKEKIVDTMLKKYGETSFTKTKEYMIKRKETCMKRYGYEDHMKSPKYRDMFSGSKSPVWKGGINDERWERLSKPYKKWRQSIFERDHFICQKCEKHSKKLEAHHIANWKDNVDLRYNKNNGITFCENCHREFHSLFGKKNNNAEQIEDFIKNR